MYEYYRETNRGTYNTYNTNIHKNIAILHEY